MLATAILRLGGSRVATRPVVRVGSVGLTRSVPLTLRQVRGLATTTSTVTTTKTPRKTTTKAKTTTTKAAKKPITKKVAKKPAKKVKKVVKPKDKPWEARDASGKLIPLPSATKPKKASAFAFFLQSRSREAKTDPSMLTKNKEGVDVFDVTKLSKNVGSEWKSMSASQKQPFEDQAEAAKIAYEAAMHTWRASLTSEDIRRQNSYLSYKKKKTGKIVTGKIRDPAKPIRYASPFFQFLKDYRERGSTGSVAEMAKAAGAEWKLMSKEDKEPYELMTQGAREQYQRDVAEYKQSQA